MFDAEINAASPRRASDDEDGECCLVGGSLMGTEAEEDLEGLARSIIAFKLN